MLSKSSKTCKQPDQTVPVVAVHPWQPVANTCDLNHASSTQVNTQQRSLPVPSLATVAYLLWHASASFVRGTQPGGQSGRQNINVDACSGADNTTTRYLKRVVFVSESSFLLKVMCHHGHNALWRQLYQGVSSASMHNIFPSQMS